jgi:hypothetical protein
MRIKDLIVEGKGNQGPRATAALIDYLKTLTKAQLKRTYVHTSSIAKVGIKPYNNVTINETEPVGIYTYNAIDWLKRKGSMSYSGLPYIHAIRIKTSTKVADWAQTEALMRKFIQENPAQAEQGASALLTKYLIRMGYGMVSRPFEWDIEYIILGRQFIENVHTFDAYHMPTNVKHEFDPMSGETLFDYALAKTGLSQYDDFLNSNPELKQDLMIDYLDNKNPAVIAKIRYLLYALKNNLTLTKEQQKNLLLPDEISGDQTHYRDLYKQYSKIVKT